MTLNEVELIRKVPLVEQVLNAHAVALADDLVPYRNHVYRVINLCRLIASDKVDPEMISVAAVFHDLGIWTHKTFDYLAPSASLARTYLEGAGQCECISEISQTIANHHRVSSLGSEAGKLGEAFRRADWIDVTRGVRRFGVQRQCVNVLYERWPSFGFHRRLATLAIERLRRYPLNPLPMVKW